MTNATTFTFKESAGFVPGIGLSYFDPIELKADNVAAAYEEVLDLLGAQGIDLDIDDEDYGNMAFAKNGSLRVGVIERQTAA